MHFEVIPVTATDAEMLLAMKLGAGCCCLLFLLFPRPPLFPVMLLLVHVPAEDTFLSLCLHPLASPPHPTLATLVLLSSSSAGMGPRLELKVTVRLALGRGLTSAATVGVVEGA